MPFQQACRNGSLDENKQDICQDLKDIAATLDNVLGCNQFNYARYYWNKMCFTLSSRYDWWQLYLKNKHYLYNQLLPKPYYSGNIFLDEYKQYFKDNPEIDIHPYSALHALLQSEQALDMCHQAYLVQTSFWIYGDFWIYFIS